MNESLLRRAWELGPDSTISLRMTSDCFLTCMYFTFLSASVNNDDDDHLTELLQRLSEQKIEKKLDKRLAQSEYK